MSEQPTLYCSSDDRWFLGLAAGLGHKLGIPSPAMRFLLFLTIWLYGTGFFFYLVGFFLPKIPTRQNRFP